MQSIFQRLETIRTKADLTWADLADSLELSVSMLMQVRRGDRNLSHRSLHRLRELERASGIEPPFEVISDALRELPALPDKKNVIAKLRRQVQNLQLQIDAITESLNELEP